MIPRVPEHIYEVGFSLIEREAYLYVCMRGCCFDDKRTMAKRIGVCKTRLWKALKTLVEHGWLIQKKAGRSTCYLARGKGKPIESASMTNTKAQRRVREDGHVNDIICPPSRTLTNRDNIYSNINKEERDEIMTEIILAGRSKRNSVSRSVPADIKAGKPFYKV